MTKIDPFPKTGTELKKIIREEVRNELAITKTDIVDSVAKLITHFKSDVLDSVDLVLREIKKSREEQTVQSFKLSDHEDRIGKLETKSSLTV